MSDLKDHIAQLRDRLDNHLGGDQGKALGDPVFKFDATLTFAAHLSEIEAALDALSTTTAENERLREALTTIRDMPGTPENAGDKAIARAALSIPQQPEGGR